MRHQMDRDNAIELSSKNLRHFDVPLDPQAPLFVIGVASVMAGLPVWTLRKLDGMGAVSPGRAGVRTRCYSQVQIKQLRYVRYLMEERHVNISAVKVILEIEMRGA